MDFYSAKEMATYFMKPQFDMRELPKCLEDFQWSKEYTNWWADYHKHLDSDETLKTIAINSLIRRIEKSDISFPCEYIVENGDHFGHGFYTCTVKCIPLTKERIKERKDREIKELEERIEILTNILKQKKEKYKDAI